MIKINQLFNLPFLTCSKLVNNEVSSLNFSKNTHRKHTRKFISISYILPFEGFKRSKDGKQSTEDDQRFARPLTLWYDNGMLKIW